MPSANLRDGSNLLEVMDGLRERVVLKFSTFHTLSFSI